MLVHILINVMRREGLRLHRFRRNPFRQSQKEIVRRGYANGVASATPLTYNKDKNQNKKEETVLTAEEIYIIVEALEMYLTQGDPVAQDELVRSKDKDLPPEMVVARNLWLRFGMLRAEHLKVQRVQTTLGTLISWLPPSGVGLKNIEKLLEQLKGE